MMAGHGQQEVRRSTSAEYNLAGSLPKTLILPIYIYVYIDQHFIVIAFWRVIAVSSVSSVTLSVVAVDFTRYTYRRAIR